MPLLVNVMRIGVSPACSINCVGLELVSDNPEASQNVTVDQEYHHEE